MGDMPANERQARELAPLLDAPETLREAWAEVVELHPEPKPQPPGPGMGAGRYVVTDRGSMRWTFPLPARLRRT